MQAIVHESKDLAAAVALASKAPCSGCSRVSQQIETLCEYTKSYMRQLRQRKGGGGQTVAEQLVASRFIQHLPEDKPKLE